MTRWGLFTTLAVPVVGAGLALAVVAAAPPGAVTRKSPPVGELPEETSSNEFLLLEDESTFDMRDWRPVHWWNRWYRWSPVNYTNALTIRRVGKARDYVAHFSTTGLAIDLECVPIRCVLRREDVKARRDTAKARDTAEALPDPRMKVYSVSIPLDRVPQGGEVRVIVRGTYWNGAADPRSSAAGTYTTNDIAQMRRLVLIVLLPRDKPAREPRMMWGPTTREHREIPYPAPSDLRVTVGGRELEWVISRREPSHHYQLVWDW